MTEFTYWQQDYNGRVTTSFYLNLSRIFSSVKTKINIKFHHIEKIQVIDKGDIVYLLSEVSNYLRELTSEGRGQAT